MKIHIILIIQYWKISLNIPLNHVVSCKSSYCFNLSLFIVYFSLTVLLEISKHSTLTEPTFVLYFTTGTMVCVNSFYNQALITSFIIISVLICYLKKKSDDHCFFVYSFSNSNKYYFEDTKTTILSKYNYTIILLIINYS